MTEPDAELERIDPEPIARWDGTRLYLPRGVFDNEKAMAWYREHYPNTKLFRMGPIPRPERVE